MISLLKRICNWWRLNHLQKMQELQERISMDLEALCEGIHMAYRVAKMQSAKLEAQRAAEEDPNWAWIKAERAKQDARWGEQNHNDFRWLAILSKGIGKVAACIVSHINEPMTAIGATFLKNELIQVAAVCVAWSECIERRNSET